MPLPLDREKLTPAMKQFYDFKEQYPDCILFFRMGDFYELFYDDAVEAHKTLGLTLTQRSEGVPMAGVPYHSVDGYLRRMIQAGYRVAICDQVEDPKQAKGVVKRDVTRLVTPGTLTDDSMLDEGQENPLAAVVFQSDDEVAVAYAELSTGSFGLAQLSADALVDELTRFRPNELLYVETADRRPPERVQRVADACGCALTSRPSWQFRPNEATEVLKKQYEVTTLEGYGLEEGSSLVQAAGAVVFYLLETQKLNGEQIAHLQAPRRFERTDYMIVDQASIRALEIERTMRGNEVKGSLLGAMQDCRTPMGKRLLRQWLCFPLNDLALIHQRQAMVASMVDDDRLLEELTEQLSQVQDVQRISGRIAVNRCSPRDLVALGRSVAEVRVLEELLKDRESFAGYSAELARVGAVLAELGETLNHACVEQAPAHLREGGLIADGYDEELDEARGLERDSNTWLVNYQQGLMDESGIPSLKVGYNKVFGYYIEVTHLHSDKVPVTFTRKQTLKNAERYITPELKTFEDKVLSASQRAVSREQELFTELCAMALDRLADLFSYSHLVAELDVLAGFARRAKKLDYVRPEVVAEAVLDIREGRHPVLDQMLGDGFVPNDVAIAVGAEQTDNPLAPEKAGHLGLITGPNMAGKSTYIRQTALLTLLAHTGSFIPAASAKIGLTDRIFTRVGASDELHGGQSTFMVEMTETANICHHATEHSLVVLDEVGRGTSTLDGLSLAWAIAEYLAAKRCRALFATHYHELTQLAERFDNIFNLNVAVREWEDEVVFLHKIASGGTDRSYGIHVAKIAGLPRLVVERSRELMAQLEVNTQRLEAEMISANAQTTDLTDLQMSLFTEYVEHPVLSEIRKIDLNQLSPMDAFDYLRRLRHMIDSEV